MQGWRMVFYSMAGVAGLTTILMLIFGIEPRNIRVKDGKEVEPERHRVAKLHILKQIFGGVVVSLGPTSRTKNRQGGTCKAQAHCHLHKFDWSDRLMPFPVCDEGLLDSPCGV